MALYRIIRRNSRLKEMSLLVYLHSGQYFWPSTVGEFGRVFRRTRPGRGARGSRSARRRGAAAFSPPVVSTRKYDRILDLAPVIETVRVEGWRRCTARRLRMPRTPQILLSILGQAPANHSLALLACDPLSPPRRFLATDGGGSSSLSPTGEESSS
jgi:hypothetical protein